MKDLEDAQKAIEEGNVMQALRQKIKEPEDDNKDLKVYLLWKC